MRLVTVIMGGVVGATPSMMSASVMALARLLYEFPQQLAPLVPRMLPPVLLLLRSKNREVVKAVLGFIKVNVCGGRGGGVCGGKGGVACMACVAWVLFLLYLLLEMACIHT